MTSSRRNEATELFSTALRRSGSRSQARSVAQGQSSFSSGERRPRLCDVAVMFSKCNDNVHTTTPIAAAKGHVT